LSELVAGTSAVVLETPIGVEMMGYGARTGTAQRVHDPLHARALYLASDSDLLLIECELCLLAPSQAEGVRERIAAETGIARDRIMVGCTHTHSGPDTGLGALLGGSEPPDHVAPLLEALIEAGVRAHANAAAARLGVGRAEAHIGRNRRSADGPLDTDVLVIRVDRADGSPLSVLYVHGCHPTALGHDNLAYSADWPGAAGRAIQEGLPGCNPIFVLGAHADVDPRTRGLLDLAIRDQSVGVGFDQVEVLGREIGRAVVAAASALETRPEAAVAPGSPRVRVPGHRADLERRRLEALTALGLPPDTEARTRDLYRLERERTADLPAEERRERIAKVRLYLRDRTAHRFAFGSEPEVETQVLRIGDAHLLGLPLEPTVDVGLDWKRRLGGRRAAVVGIANGWLRYLPHSRNFEEDLAHQKYEILQSTLVPEASDRLLAEAELLDRLLTNGHTP
jgi:neutral ceramidase